MEKGSFQVEPKEKSESGKSPSKLKLCRYHSKNIAVESGLSKSARTTPKLYLQAAMDHASSGISKNTPVCYACLKLQLSSRRSSILKNIKFWLQVLIERYLIGKNSMDRSSDPSKVLKANSTLSTSQPKASTSSQVGKMASSESGIMTKASAILKDKGIPDLLASSESHLIRERSSLWAQKELCFSGTCLKALWRTKYNPSCPL